MLCFSRCRVQDVRFAGLSPWKGDFSTQSVIIVNYSQSFIAAGQMEAMRQQNEQLQTAIESMLEEIEKQKDINSQHENEITTLLNFNQRLLQIIDKEMNNANKDNVSLQPISERSERQSDLVAPICSSIKPRKFDGSTRSEKGYHTTQSLIDRPHLSGNRLDLFKKEVQKSEMNYDGAEEESIKESSQSSRKQYQVVIEQSNKVKNEMSQDIQQLRQFRNESNKFYDNKIKEVRALGTRLNKYGPAQQLSQISEKLNLSPSTASLLKKVVSKGNQ